MTRLGACGLWVAGALVMTTAVVGHAQEGVEPVVGHAQEGVEPFVGILAGVSALSADTTTVTPADGFRFSTYAPQNGTALNLYAGAHLTDYVTVQANYLWNRNDLGLQTGWGARRAIAFDSVITASSQHGVVGDFLLYFRDRRSWVRPYLSAGVGMFRLSSTLETDEAPTIRLIVDDGTFTSTTPVLRVAVGMDIAVGDRWSIRYSFSEGISPNPIGDHLDPPGERVLMNFQNLVGVMTSF